MVSPSRNRSTLCRFLGKGPNRHAPSEPLCANKVNSSSCMRTSFCRSPSADHSSSRWEPQNETDILPRIGWLPFFGRPLKPTGRLHLGVAYQVSRWVVSALTFNCRAVLAVAMVQSSLLSCVKPPPISPQKKNGRRLTLATLGSKTDGWSPLISLHKKVKMGCPIRKAQNSLFLTLPASFLLKA